VKSYDAIVIGAGIAGLSIARELANLKQRVLILEREEKGGVTSKAAAGFLDPYSDLKDQTPLFRLGLQALDQYPSFLQEMGARAISQVEYEKLGILYLAIRAEDEELFKERLGRMVNGPIDKKLKLALKQIDVVLAADLQGKPELYKRASMTVTQEPGFKFNKAAGERAFDASESVQGESLENVPVEHIISAALLKLIGERLDKFVDENGWVKAETEIAFNQFVLFVQALAVDATSKIRIARAA